jgi:hypothetical protein
VEQQPAGRHAVEQRTIEQRRTAFSVVRPQILWDKHGKARGSESA